jgi:hypothetical protein
MRYSLHMRSRGREIWRGESEAADDAAALVSLLDAAIDLLRNGTWGDQETSDVTAETRDADGVLHATVRIRSFDQHSRDAGQDASHEGEGHPS